MVQQKVEICGVNTAKLPLLKQQEKEALFVRIKDGDNEAREEFIKGNLRLVLSVIKRFSSSNENVDDLFQIGCIGLMKAIDNFDITLNVKFSTYAVPMIMGEIRRFLRDNSSIRVSRSIKDTAYKAIYTKENMMKKSLREPTLAEVAKEVGVSKEEIVYALDAIQNPMSLYDPVYSDGEDTLYVMDQISDKKNKARPAGCRLPHRVLQHEGAGGRDRAHLPSADPCEISFPTPDTCVSGVTVCRKSPCRGGS